MATVVVINDGASDEDVIVIMKGKTVTGITTVQSTDGSYYKNVEVSSVGDPIRVPSKSISTIVLSL
jgi:hypothetical protein